MNRPPALLCAMLAVVLLSTPSSAQYLYFSDTPNACFPYGQMYEPIYVYVHSPDDDGFTGATFTLELTSFSWANLVSYVPEPGVTVVSLDMAPGSGVQPMTAVIELTWTQRALVHEPVLAFAFSASGNGEANIFDATLARTGGGSEPATGVTTEFMIVDCFDPFLWLDLPSVIDVPVGTPTTAELSWVVVFYTVVGSDLVMSDDLGWLQTWSPSSVWGGANCGDCFFDWSPGDFSVLVPAGTAPGTESTLTISAPQFGCDTAITLRADAPVPTEPSTWGKIKALFD